MSTKLNASTLVIDIQCATTALEANLHHAASSNVIKKWVKAAIPDNGLLTLRFVNATEGKKLNLAFRNKDYATNVLTFPYELTKNFLVADIVFCFPVIQKEAKDQNKALKAHLAHLVVHGCLHAKGHDHEIEKDAKRMESLEINILQKLGFANPY